MKEINIPGYIMLFILIILNANCEKEYPTTRTSASSSTPILPPPPPPPPPPPLPVPNTAPNCNAGQDQLVFFPTSFCTLNGHAYDRENNIRTVLWSKISGPSSFLIAHPDSLSTVVSNLQIGVYQFELTVTDSMGMYGKDTINVIVDQMPVNTNEIILENLVWVFPWYNAIEVKNFYDLIPSGSMFRIYIRRATSPDWIEAYPESNYVTNAAYEYFIETRPDGAGIYTYGSLYIFYYGMDTSDTPDVKIVFW